MIRFTLPLLLLASPASAQTSGFLNGFAHPVLGFDHLLAMIAVGLLSVQLGGRWVWMTPAVFVLALCGGGLLGLLEIPLPNVEGVISLSVLLLGLAIAAQVRFAPVPSSVVVAIFGVFHGHAHGVEAPQLADPWSYVIGFMAASAVLHLLGVGLGALAKTSNRRALFGAGCAGAGAHLALLTYGLV